MNRFPYRAALSGLPVLMALLQAPPAVALTLEQALQQAEVEAPSLQARAAEQQAARSAAIPAGELPDPQLKLGLLNVPMEEDDRWSLDRERMTQSMIGISQAMPNSDKRAAWQDVANADIGVADAQARIEHLQVQQETARAWIAALAVERKLELFQGFYRENRLFQRAIKALIAGGKGLAADSVLPTQERALLEEQEDRLHQQQRSARAALQRWVGPRAGDALDGDWPRWPGNIADYRQNLRTHPVVIAYDPRSERAQAQIREAVADKTPDWGWEVDYQRRGKAYSDMVSLKLSFDLPMFTSTRQDPRIAARRSQAAALEAEREATLRAYAQQLEDLLAERQRLKKAVTRIEKTLVPLAEQRIRLAMSDYSGGRGTLLAVVDARRELIRTRLRRIDLMEQQAQVNAGLHFAYGETSR